MELKTNYPEEYEYFSEVLDVQGHMVPNLPSNYVFMLHLCYQKNCIHPFVLLDVLKKSVCGLKIGPLSYVLLPIPDPERPWESECKTCTESCGHYLSPEKNWELVKVSKPQENKPVQTPRQILGDFCKKNTDFSEADVQNLPDSVF